MPTVNIVVMGRTEWDQVVGVIVMMVFIIVVDRNNLIFSTNNTFFFMVLKANGFIVLSIMRRHYLFDTANLLRFVFATSGTKEDATLRVSLL